MSPYQCADLTERRQKCHNLYGKFGEDCLVEELEEKRCLSFHFCPREAKAYYATQLAEKGICASWAESFCFARDTMIDDEGGVRQHHVSASERVNRNPKIKAKCRSIAFDLAKCLQKKR